MAGVRGGYRNYRGRRSKGKALLAVLLVLVILAACVVMLLQRHIVYDNTGTPHLERPWNAEENRKEPEEPLDLDLVIREPEETAVRAFSVPAGPLTAEGYEAARRDNAGASAVKLTLKDQDGLVYFDAAALAPDILRLAEDTVAALERAVEELYAIAELSCFRDAEASGLDAEAMGLTDREGYLFYDGANATWMDPAKPAARAYLCRLAGEAAALGFDEILLADVSYPTEGVLEEIPYSREEQAAHLVTFLKELRTALEPYGTAVSLKLAAEALSGEAGDPVPAELLVLADRVYVPGTMEALQSLRDALTAAGGETEVIPLLDAPAETGGYLLN